MLFKNPNDTDNKAIRQAIKQWLIELKHLSEDVAISVVELNCCGEQCPHIETVISIFYENLPTEVLKVSKPLTFVRKHDLTALCSVAK
jgi:hypothetical protein